MPQFLQYWIIDEWILITVLIALPAWSVLWIPAGQTPFGPVRGSPGYRKPVRPSHLRLVGVWGNRVLKRLDMVALPLLSLLGAALVAIAFIFGELRDAAGATGSQIDAEDLASVVDAVHWAVRMVSIATSGLLAWAAALALRPCARNWMAGLQPLPRLGDYSTEARRIRRLEARAILAWLAAVTAAVSALAVIAMTPVLANALFSVLDLS